MRKRSGSAWAVASVPWREEWSDLARYNAERSRGLVHTPEWAARMAKLQREFNDAHSPHHFGRVELQREDAS